MGFSNKLVEGILLKTNKIAKLIIYIIFTAFSLACIIPLVAIISISLSNEMDIVTSGYSLIPRKIDFSAYRFVLNQPLLILNAYKISIIVCTVGTALGLFTVSGVAYALSRPDFKLRRQLSFYVFFIMLFNGGVVPWYMLIARYLQLKDNIWVLILPYLATPWFILVLRTFMQKLPIEIIESCKIDGANEFRVFFTIVLPLSKAGLATIGLFILLQYWNDWWLSLLFIEVDKMVPLQYMLYRIMGNIQFLINSYAMPTNMKTMDIPNESARMAMAVLATGPMLFVFPFFQRYFVRGLTVGALKG